jgi:drug/metabolite transporter (DMT)-like permease
LFSVLLITFIPVLLLAPFFSEQLHSDVQRFRLLPVSEQWIILVIAITSLAGTSLVYLAINSRNATLASLIEISYPLFVAIFSYVLFRQMHINTSVVIGGILVMAGTALIIYNNQ